MVNFHLGFIYKCLKFINCLINIYRALAIYTNTHCPKHCRYTSSHRVVRNRILVEQGSKSKNPRQNSVYPSAGQRQSLRVLLCSIKPEVIR